MQSNVVRLCGTRVPGGVYATTPATAGGGVGKEVERYLIDPPIYRIKTSEGFMPVIEAFGVTPIGVSLWRDKSGTWHLLDWVGSKSYPNVQDWIEEVRLLGVSRRVPVTLDFSLLGPKSKIFMFHSRAQIHNAAEYLLDEAQLVEVDDETFKECPFHHEAHESGQGLGMCVRLYRQDVWDGESVGDENNPRRVLRELPAGDYAAYAPPEDVEAEYAPAMFAAFPIVNLEVVKADDGRDAKALEAAAMSGIDARVVTA